MGKKGQIYGNSNDTVVFDTTSKFFVQKLKSLWSQNKDTNTQIRLLGLIGR